MRESLRSLSKDNTNSNQSYSKSGIIMDPESKIKYRKGRKIGGGGFGEVYEFIEIETNKKRAAKIISNSRIDNDPQSNIAYNNEYKFNTHLDFKYLCKCHSTFKDNQNAYFILDFQPNKTLSELLNKRQLSEIEIKHYCFELLLAIEYLHKRNIIHRDIKLSNVLLNEKMEVRLGDFGLAIENGLERQKNICGTPNYIAPELLNHKNGLNYSFEIDIWAFGVLLYTLYYNKTPFEQEVKGRTKYNIQHIIYSFPKDVKISKEAKDLISSILVEDPKQRPTIEQIKASPFFKNGQGIPKYLPPSTMIRAMSPEEEKNFVNNAINDGECLDKDANLPNKSTSFSMKVKYYNKPNNEQNESDSNYTPSYSSSKDEEDNNNEEKDKKGNKDNVNEKNEVRSYFSLKNENEEEETNKSKRIKQTSFLFNNSFANNFMDKNASREESNKVVKLNSNKYISTRRELSNFYNNSKSYGKMSETAGFISNNLSGSNSDFFFPGTKFNKEDSITLNKDELKLNENEDKNEDKNFKVIPKFKLRHKNRSTGKTIKKSSYFKYLDENNNNQINHKNMGEDYNDFSLSKKSANNIIINKFIDISDKCGLGYILSNGDIGACFNDGTNLIRIKCTLNYVYTNEQGKIELISTKKKIKNKDYKTKVEALLLFNKAFIKNSKFRSSFKVDPNLNKNYADLYVKKWVKSQHAYFFLLSNEKVQVIFDDKSIVLFDFRDKQVTFMNKSKKKITNHITLKKFGDEDMNKRVSYAKKVLGKL